jgi:hypothetical protein
MAKNIKIEISCKKCGHKVFLTPVKFRDLLGKLSTNLAQLSRESLYEIAKKLKCSECGAKAARIGKYELRAIESIDTAKLEDTCKICQRVFIPPKFVLRSNMGLCTSCQADQVAKQVKNDRGSASVAPKPKPIGRYMDNLPPGGRIKQNRPTSKEAIQKYDIPEYEEGTPRPGWASDSDWKKMRSGQYSDMKKRQRGG